MIKKVLLLSAMVLGLHAGLACANPPPPHPPHPPHPYHPPAPYYHGWHYGSGVVLWNAPVATAPVVTTPVVVSAPQTVTTTSTCTQKRVSVSYFYDDSGQQYKKEGFQTVCS